MKAYNTIVTLATILCCITATICLISFAGGVWFKNDVFKLSAEMGMKPSQQLEDSTKCNNTVKCKPNGSEALPEGIVSPTSDLEMRPMWGKFSKDKKLGLLAIPVGIRQKVLVNQTVSKFLGHNFSVILFHYDGTVDQWHELEWSSRVIHVSAMNQTKWWFAKRFLHPDVVAEYEYIFVWDEDLGVENFDPERYVSIVKEEGLEISQPALDTSHKVNFPISARRSGSKVHRRYIGGRGCNANSTGPPCVGWVEMMAPVFSRASWRCVWYMIQNDLVHAWGLDFSFGYCSQGDPTVKVGVVDEQYIVNEEIYTLGVSSKNKVAQTVAPPSFDTRSAARQKAHDELLDLQRRWKQAVDKDQCWRDPFVKKH